MPASTFSIRLFFSLSFLLLLNLPLLATGVLDKSFGNNGKASFIEKTYSGGKVLIQPDDKIIVASRGFSPLGGASLISVVRYNADGSLDNTFNAGSAVSFGEGANVGNIKLQSDGKIIIVGQTLKNANVSSGVYYIVRLNSDGSFDQTFGVSGQVRIDRNVGISEILFDVVIQTDGKIVAVGRIDGYSAEAVRLNSNGSIDTGFANSGFFTALSTPSSVYFLSFYTVALTANNKIFVSGYKESEGEYFFGGLIRLNEDGSLDKSFGGNGLVQLINSRLFFIQQPDGKIIYVGGNGIHRLLPDGSFDWSFNSSQLIDGVIKSLPDGRILVASNSKIYLLGSNGQLIGKANIFQSENSQDSISFADIATQSNGKIVAVVNYSRPSDATIPPNIFLVRYNSITSLANRIADYDSDEKVDIGVYRPSNQTFYLLQSNAGFKSYTTQTPVNNLFPEDYSADFASDLVWSSVQQSYNYFCGFNGTTVAPDCYQWGLSTDVPLGGDYDGDNKSDFAIYRNGFWHIFQSSTNTSLYFNWGTTGDKPVPADYDGDGKTDAAIYRPSTGTWWVLQSSDSTYRAFQFGLSDDKPVPADYDGDGRADFAVYRPNGGVWYLYQSTSGFAAAQFGISTDRPVPGDYDGDGRTDVAVFRPSEGNWYLLESTNGFAAIHWGQNGDIPLTTAYSAY